MTEPLQRSKQYEYRANSNLVLQSTTSNRRDEASGEVESLFGKLSNTRMGDRSSNLKRENDYDTSSLPDKKRRFLKNTEGDDDRKQDDVYIPRLKESKIFYEEFLGIIVSHLGDQPQDVIRGACDEVIAILRSDSKDNLKQGDVQKVIGTFSLQIYSRMLHLSQQLHDFSNELGVNPVDTNLDDEIGVAVVFDDDEDETNEDDNDNLESNDDPNLDDLKSRTQLRGHAETLFDEVTHSELHTTEIDAFWLQRQLSVYYNDAEFSSILAEDILNVLSISDDRVCENKLVALLNFDKFNLVKILMLNRFKIYFCSRYRNSQSDEERFFIQQEMMNESSGIGELIFSEINQKSSANSWSQDRIGQFTVNARKEVQNLNSRTNEENEESANISLVHDNLKILDLDSLSFHQGNHFASNSTCELPSKSWRALKKGYEEVHVPAVKPIIPSDEVLKSIQELPDWCWPCFNGISHLNRVQSKMLNSALYTSENLLLCAPTGK